MVYNFNDLISFWPSNLCGACTLHMQTHAVKILKRSTTSAQLYSFGETLSNVSGFSIFQTNLISSMYQLMFTIMMIFSASLGAGNREKVRELTSHTFAQHVPDLTKLRPIHN